MDWIKINVEGFESEVFQGARNVTESPMIVTRHGSNVYDYPFVDPIRNSKITSEIFSWIHYSETIRIIYPDS